MHSSSELKPLPFFDPALWTPPKNPTFFQLIKALLYTASDPYLSNVHFSKNKDSHIFFEINPIDFKARPLAPRRLDGISLLYSTINACLALAAVRSIATVVVKIWKEKAPAAFHYIQQPATSLLSRTFHRLVFAGVVTALLFTAVKIALRLSHQIHIIPPKSNNGISAPPPKDEVD